MYSSSRGILYTPPPAEDGSENDDVPGEGDEVASEDMTTAEASEETPLPPADD